ncbi:Acetylesterase [Hypsizygus marmoreus]|uniref:Acetylesterase n=1 Tax=Hypsizygus marmoreus TaxID=39966 RepID=A0A369JR11_HYPMA|nr:Acetylesterase [Hypsizygus marmoreus]
MRVAAPFPALFCFIGAVPALGRLTWGETKFLFTFGDSYTTDSFNVSAGVDSPVPGFTSSNGPNWVQFLVFNLASGGATIDAVLVPPFQPTVLYDPPHTTRLAVLTFDVAISRSIVEQVSQFKRFLAPKTQGAA